MSRNFGVNIADYITNGVTPRERRVSRNIVAIAACAIVLSHASQEACE